MAHNDTESPPGSILEERLRSPGLLLALLGQEAMRRLRAAHAAVELSPRRFQLLALLHDRGAMSQADLHEAMAVDPSALVQLLNPLEENGFVSRRRDARDRRRHIVSLTAAGERRLIKATRAQRQAEDELFAALDAGQRQALSELLLVVRGGSGESPCLASDDPDDGPGEQRA